MLLFLLTIVHALLIGGCVKGVSIKKDTTLGEHPTQCFRADYIDEKGRKTYSWNCFVTYGYCDGALRVSKKYGSLANVTSLSECKEIDLSAIQD